MGLLDLQSALARLYTDSAFRDRFFTDSAEACREIRLTVDERRLIAALDRAQVERFARSLKQKRLGLVRELLPATAHLLGETMAGAFFGYCDRQPSARERLDEATGFIDDLLAVLPGDVPDLSLPDHWRDLLRCERLHVELLAPQAAAHPPAASTDPPLSPAQQLASYPQRTGCVRVERFQYDISALYPKAMRGELDNAPPDPCFALIARPADAPRARMKRINAPSAQLLTLCDGTRKLEEILREVAAALRLPAADRPAFVAECLRFLAPLAEHDLIHWRRQPA